jgi:VanZ family protein
MTLRQAQGERTCYPLMVSLSNHGRDHVRLASMHGVTCGPEPANVILPSVSIARRLPRLAVLVGWMLLITYWSDQPTLPIDQPEVKWLLFNMQHRLAHLVAYGLLGALAAWAFQGWRRGTISAMVLASLFGALDEWHQLLVPGRKSGIDDWLFDTFSAALAIYVWPRIQRSRPQLGRLGPLTVSAIFAVGLVLLVRPHLSRPPELSRAGLRTISNQVLINAREVARQIRSVTWG